MKSQHFLDAVRDWLHEHALSVAVIVVVTIVILKVAAVVNRHMFARMFKGKSDEDSQKLAQTLSSVIRWVLRTGILLVAAVMLLGQLGVQIGPILAAAGVVGVAVGFGAQNLVQDVISGFFLLLEDQVRVGDVVQLNDKSGLVEKITLRMIILRDASGSVHYVRNGKIDVVTNMTKEFSYAVFDISVAYDEDSDQVSAAIKAVGKDLQQDPVFKNDILAPVEVLGLDKFAESAMVIKARIKTRPSRQWDVGREFNRRLKKEFDELGIEIPFPHITLHSARKKPDGSPTQRIGAEGGEA